MRYTPTLAMRAARLGCLCALVLGCDPAERQPRKAEPEAESVVAKPQQNAVSDKLLSVQQYSELGVPACDREWSGYDMARAQQALARLARRERQSLPRFESERSGAVFARMTARDNLNLYKNRSLPLDARISQLLMHFRATNGIIGLYLSAAKAGESYNCEMVECFNSQKRASVLLFDLADELMLTLDKSDPASARRMVELKSVKGRTAELDMDSLQWLHEPFDAGTHARLIETMIEIGPRIAPELPLAFRQELIAQVECYLEDPKLAEHRDQLLQLLALLKDLPPATMNVPAP
jgi:hypothetical protein